MIEYVDAEGRKYVWRDAENAEKVTPEELAQWVSLCEEMRGNGLKWMFERRARWLEEMREQNEQRRKITEEFVMAIQKKEELIKRQEELVLKTEKLAGVCY